MLSAADTPVVERPELRPLRARLPLSELVAQREDALLGASLLLVAPGSAEDGVELVLGDGVQERRRLQPVARRVAGLFAHATLVDRVLDGGHDEPLAQLRHAAVAELEHLGEVVARVDVHDREGEARRPEGLLGEAQEHDGVLAAGEEQHGPLELRGDLAHDEDGLRLERIQVADALTGGAFRQRSRLDHVRGCDLCSVGQRVRRFDFTSHRTAPRGRRAAGPRTRPVLWSVPDQSDRDYRDTRWT